MVKANGQMLSVRASLMCCSKVEATHVVLKCAAFNAGHSTMNGEALFVKVFK